MEVYERTNELVKTCRRIHFSMILTMITLLAVSAAPSPTHYEKAIEQVQVISDICDLVQEIHEFEYRDTLLSSTLDRNSETEPNPAKDQSYPSEALTRFEEYLSFQHKAWIKVRLTSLVEWFPESITDRANEIVDSNSQTGIVFPLPDISFKGGRYDFRTIQLYSRPSNLAGFINFWDKSYTVTDLNLYRDETALPWKDWEQKVSVVRRSGRDAEQGFPTDSIFQDGINVSARVYIDQGKEMDVLLSEVADDIFLRETPVWARSQVPKPSTEYRPYIAVAIKLSSDDMSNEKVVVVNSGPFAFDTDELPKESKNVKLLDPSRIFAQAKSSAQGDVALDYGFSKEPWYLIKQNVNIREALLYGLNGGSIKKSRDQLDFAKAFPELNAVTEGLRTISLADLAIVLRDIQQLGKGPGTLWGISLPNGATWGGTILVSMMLFLAGHLAELSRQPSFSRSHIPWLPLSSFVTVRWVAVLTCTVFPVVILAINNFVLEWQLLSKSEHVWASAVVVSACICGIVLFLQFTRIAKNITE